jgi:hypothetical protein
MGVKYCRQIGRLLVCILRVCEIFERVYFREWLVIFENWVMKGILLSQVVAIFRFIISVLRLS